MIKTFNFQNCRLHPLPIFEILKDKLTRFHKLNTTTSTLLSDLTSAEVEANQHKGEAETPEVQQESGEDRSRSPEPNPEFVQNVLRETREMLRNNNYSYSNYSYNNLNGRGRGRGKGRGKPNKD